MVAPMITIDKPIQTTPRTPRQWIETIHALGPEFESRAAESDRDASFVTENYAALKEVEFFRALVPVELGGGGLPYSALCEVLRVLAQYCGSTALASSMHQHLLSANVWKHRQGQDAKALLTKVASEQTVLISTGARDWLESNGELVAVEGGYRMTATKAFASQSVAGDLLITSAPYRDPQKGWQVLHFPVPITSPGVSIRDDWHTLGMRGTGSHTVQLKDVFIPEERIALRRPRGEFHPFFNVVAAVAMPLIMSVYLGIAQKATRLALQAARARKQPKPYLAGSVGAMFNELKSAEVHVKDMIRLANELEFKAENSLGQEVLSRKTNAANACLGAVTKAMEIAGGQGFYQSFGLERLFRDIQAANHHPLPEKEQQQFLGEYLLAPGGQTI